MAQQWALENNWAAPPITMILQVIKLTTHQCTAVSIIAPVWKGC